MNMSDNKPVLVPVCLANVLSEIIELNSEPIYWNVDICEGLGGMITLEIHFRGTEKKVLCRLNSRENSSTGETEKKQ